MRVSLACYKSRALLRPTILSSDFIYFMLFFPGRHSLFLDFSRRNFFFRLPASISTRRRLLWLCLSDLGGKTRYANMAFLDSLFLCFFRPINMGREKIQATISRSPMRCDACFCCFIAQIGAV